MQALQKAGNFCKQAVPNEHQTASSASPHYTLSPPPAQKKIAQKNANCAARKYFEIIELLSRRSHLQLQLTRLDPPKSPAHLTVHL